MRKNPFIKKKQKDKLNDYYVYVRSKRPIHIQEKDVVSVIKKAVSFINADDILEVHDENYKILWGRNTGFIK